MGADKSALQFGGRSLLERAFEIARAAGGVVSIVGSGEDLKQRAAELGAPAVGDLFPGQGPLAGIHSALECPSAGDLNFILAVDLPLISTRFVRYLLERARKSQAEVTVARVAGRLQTLCGAYGRSFAGRAQSALEQGRNKIELAFAPASLDVISECELAAGGFAPALFLNVNTPEDFTRAEAILQSGVPEAEIG